MDNKSGGRNDADSAVEAIARSTNVDTGTNTTGNSTNYPLSFISFSRILRSGMDNMVCYFEMMLRRFLLAVCTVYITHLKHTSSS